MGDLLGSTLSQLLEAELSFQYTRNSRFLDLFIQTLSSLDMLIAAQAISAGAVLVTRDKIFEQVPDLHATVNWATDL